MYRMRLIGKPRMVAEMPAPTVVEKSSSPAASAAIAVGGDIKTRSTSMPSRAKNPLSLPKKSGMEVRLLVGIWISARVLVCPAQLSKGSSTIAAHKPWATRDLIREGLIAKVQSPRIVAEHCRDEFLVEILPSANFFHGARIETIVMRKVRGEHQRVRADGFGHVGNASFIKFERDKTLAAEIGAWPLFQVRYLKMIISRVFTHAFQPVRHPAAAGLHEAHAKA